MSTTTRTSRATTSSTFRPSSSRARAWFATRADGDFADPDALDPSSPVHPGHGVPPRPWTWLRQVHGAEVVTVRHPGDHAGAEADAAVTACPGAVLVVRTADCAPVALGSTSVVGIAHAGWRGLVAGVVEATVDAMRALGAGAITARIGPCISPSAYEFGAQELDVVAARYGDAVRASTASGAGGLDLVAGVRAALDGCGVAVAGAERPPCTAASADTYFSHRARQEPGRQATFVWLEP